MTALDDLAGSLYGRLDDPARDAGHEAPPPRKGFFTDTSVCIGCKACEVACKEWNAVPEDGLDLLGMSYDNTGGLGADSWRAVAFIEQSRPVVDALQQETVAAGFDAFEEAARVGALVGLRRQVVHRARVAGVEPAAVEGVALPRLDGGEADAVEPGALRLVAEDARMLVGRRHRRRL